METTPTNAERMPELKEIAEAFDAIENNACGDTPSCTYAYRTARSFASDITHLLNQEPWVKGAVILPKAQYDALVGALLEARGWFQSTEDYTIYSGVKCSTREDAFREIKAALALVAPQPQPDTEERSMERDRRAGKRGEVV